MSVGQILDGRAVAAEVRDGVAKELKELQEKHPKFQPHLSIVQVSYPKSSHNVLLVLSINVQYLFNRLCYSVK